MSKLFIVGNGFDLAHGFDTSYNRFKERLSQNLKDETIGIPSFQTNYKGLDKYDDDEMAHYFYDLIYGVLGENWSDFEAALSELDWLIPIKNEITSLNSLGEFEDNQLINIAEDIASQMREFAFVLKERLFADWAKSIDTSHPKYLSAKLKSLIGSGQCYFLNFNYTDTLERHYRIKNVCHIHGNSTNYEELIVGHGNSCRYPNEDSEDLYMLNVSGYLDAICKDYKKNVDRAFEKHKYFFISLAAVKEIYIHGFSFSEVDMFYIEKIVAIIDAKKVIVYLHSFDKQNWDCYKRKLIACGFLDANIRRFRFNDLNDTK